MDTPEGFTRVDGYEKWSGPPVPGSGSITALDVKEGVFYVTRGKEVYRLEGEGWRLAFTLA